MNSCKHWARSRGVVDLSPSKPALDVLAMLLGLFVGHTLLCVASIGCSCLCSTLLVATCKLLLVLHVEMLLTRLLLCLSTSVSSLV